MDIHPLTGQPIATSPGARPSPVPWGSGVVISADGHVLTCAHLLPEDCDYVVRLRTGDRPARVVARDAQSDLAILAIDGKGLATLPFAPGGAPIGATELHVVGVPLVADSTWGVFEARDGVDMHEVSIAAGQGDQLRLNSPLNPGFSGAPIIDQHGDVVALVNMSWSQQGLDRAGAVDIRRAAALLKSQGISVSAGGAPVKLSSREKLDRAKDAVVGIEITTFRRLPAGSWKPVVPRMVRRFSIPGGGVSSVACSADGRTLATGVTPGGTARSEIRLQDAADGKLLHTFTGLDHGIRGLVFSPDGKFLVSTVGLDVYPRRRASGISRPRRSGSSCRTHRRRRCVALGLRACCRI